MFADSPSSGSLQGAANPVGKTAFPLLSSLLVVFAGCGKAPPVGPADVRLGEDACDACHMYIGEKLYAAQLRLADGTVEKFDDIGCLLDRVAQTSPVASYVVAQETGEWIEAKAAVYLLATELKTPMASGIAAYATLEKAKAEAERLKGKVLTYEEVSSSRDPEKKKEDSDPSAPRQDRHQPHRNQ